MDVHKHVCNKSLLKTLGSYLGHHDVPSCIPRVDGYQRWSERTPPLQKAGLVSCDSVKVRARVEPPPPAPRPPRAGDKCVTDALLAVVSFVVQSSLKYQGGMSVKYQGGN